MVRCHSLVMCSVYALGHTLDCYNGSPSFPSTAELGNIVNNYSIVLSNYDRIIYLLNKPTKGACSTVGKSPIVVNGATYNVSQLTVDGVNSYNAPSYWGAQPFTWTNLDHSLSHEIGHSFGLAHSNGWACNNGQIFQGDCQHIEYGNYFDTMGTMGYSLDYNAYFKQQLGWLPASQVLSITSPGTYTLYPLESSTGPKLAEVYIPPQAVPTQSPNQYAASIAMAMPSPSPSPSATLSPYVIEVRKGSGFDSNLNTADFISNQSGILIVECPIH